LVGAAAFWSPEPVGSEPAPMVAQLFGAGVARAGTAGPALARAPAGFGDTGLDGSAGFAATVRGAGGGSGTGLAVSSIGGGRAWVVEAQDAGRSGGGSGTGAVATGRVAAPAGTLTFVVAVRMAVEVAAGLAGAARGTGGATSAGISTRISFPQEQRWR
jgi:hypothetical protein